MASNWPQVLIKTDVRFGSKADMCSATRMSALHLIATVKADIALQDACSSRRYREFARRPVFAWSHQDREHCALLGIYVGDALAIPEQVDV